MIRRESDKNLVIGQLQTTLHKGQQLRLMLRMQGEEAEEKKVHARNRQLARQIDALLARAMEDWAGSASTTAEELRKANRSVQDGLRSVRRRRRVHDRVQGVLEKIDRVIEVAGGLLAPGA